MRKPSVFERKIQEIIVEIKNEIVLYILSQEKYTTTIDFPQEFDADHDCCYLDFPYHFTGNNVTYGVTGLFYDREESELVVNLVDIENIDKGQFAERFVKLNIQQAFDVYSFLINNVLAR